jgi:nucleotide-binding universal stress UspA family protein
MLKTILVAYDASDPADNAFEYARLIRRKFAAAIDVISVVRRPLIGDEVELTAQLEQGMRSAEQGIRRLQHRAHEEETTIRYVTTVGQPAEKIIAHADSIDADLIVTGCRGVSTLECWLTGSTVRHVMARAHRPMLIVP